MFQEMTDNERCTPPSEYSGKVYYCEQCDKELTDGDYACEYDDMIFCSEECVHDYVLNRIEIEEFTV